MLKGFKEFILRGNVLDLAVAFVIGIAFATVVTALVEGIINPLIGAVFNADSLNDSLDWQITAAATIKFGMVIAAVINFLLIAIVVYFGLVLPVNHLKKVAFQEKPVEDEALPPTELDLLSEIRDLLAKTPATNDGRHTPPVL